MLLCKRFVFRGLAFALASGAAGASWGSAVVGADYASDYVATELGGINGVDGRYGAMTFLDSNTLLIGGSATLGVATIYQVGVNRDTDGHITGFAGDAAFYAAVGNGVNAGMDGGLAYGPGGTLFYTSFPDNRIGEIKAGETSSGKDVFVPGLLPNFESAGGLAFLPGWMSGGGTTFKMVSYATGSWVTGTVSASGDYYDITLADTGIKLGAGQEGIAFVKSGSGLFGANSVLVSEYQAGDVASYAVDANGNPILSTKKVFLDGLLGAEGATIDPLTGDFLFASSTGLADGLVAVRQYGGGTAQGGATVPVPIALPAGLVLLAGVGVSRFRRRQGGVS